MFDENLAGCSDLILLLILANSWSIGLGTVGVLSLSNLPVVMIGRHAYKIESSLRSGGCGCKRVL